MENIEEKKTTSNFPQSSEGGFLDAIAILVRWKNFILVNVLIVTIVAVVVSFILPKWYKATASILPPKEHDIFGNIGGASSLLKGLAGRGLNQNQNSYNYFAILKSRTAMESVVRRFDLFSVYGIDDSMMEKAVKELSGNTSFEIQDDDNITIEVLDKNPQRAADIANYFVELLNNMSIELSTREARNNREFVEKRVSMTTQDLHIAEDSLQRYQERAGMIVAPEASSAGVSAMAELYGMKAKKEVELAILQRSVTGDNPGVRQLKVELDALQDQISGFPAIGITSLRLYRDLTIQQKILEFLTPLLEQAKVDEQKDIPVLLVLDKAVPPEKKVRPQRTLIVFVASSLALGASVFLALILHGFLTGPVKGRITMGRVVERAKAIASFYKVRGDK